MRAPSTVVFWGGMSPSQGADQMFLQWLGEMLVLGGGMVYGRYTNSVRESLYVRLGM